VTPPPSSPHPSGDSTATTLGGRPAKPSPPPRLLGDRYELIEELGRGGMGVVHRARDRETGQFLALKTLRSADPDHLYRLKKEFRSVGDLRHEHLVELYDLHLEGDTPFITMQLVDGTDLCAYLRGPLTTQLMATTLDAPGVDVSVDSLDDSMPGSEPPLYVTPDPGAVRDLFAQVLRGLAWLHANGLLHRDIKPGNVLVNRKGHVLLLDFGLATRAEETSQALSDSSSRVVGTVAYMAPEQAKGGRVTPAADLYGVGVMLYEALTGRRPHEGGFYEILYAKTRAMPAPPSAWCEEVPPDLDALTMELLALEPEDRPPLPAALQRLSHRDGRSLPSSERIPAVLPDVPRGFVGRSPEVAALREALAASEHEPVIARVHGTSGIGKTHLIREFTRQQLTEDPETLLLTGRCRPEEAVPFQALDPLVDDITRILLRLPPAQREAVLPRRPEPLIRAFPVLARVPEFRPRGKAAEVPDVPERTQLRQAFAALRELLDRLAMRRRLILRIDDFQWADRDSLPALRAVLRGPDAPPLLLIVAERTDPPDAPTVGPFPSQRLAESASVPLVDLELQPLSQGESEALVRELDSDPVQLSALVREAGGSPLFLRFAARRTAGGERPTELSQLVRERTSSLSAGARRMLEVLTVSGRPTPAAVAAVAAGCAEVKTIVRELASQRLLRKGGARGHALEPYHDKVRETVRAELPAEAVQALHVRLAEAWESSSKPDEAALAFHWQQAERPERAAGYVAAGAERAEGALAFDRAAEAWRILLDLADHSPMPLPAVRRRLAACLVQAGRSVEAGRAFLACAAEAEGNDRLDLERRAGEQLLYGGHFVEGMAAFQAVLAEVGIPSPSSRWATVARLGLRQLGAPGRLRKPLPEPRELDPAELLRLDTAYSVATGLGLVDVVLGTYVQTFHTQWALESGDRERTARALGAEASYRGTLGWKQLVPARALLDRARAALPEASGDSIRGLLSVMEATVCWGGGDWAGTVEHAEHGLAAMETLRGHRWERDLAQSVRMDALAHTGQWRRMSDEAFELIDEARRCGDLYAETMFTIRFGSLSHLAADRPEQALAGLGILARWSQSHFKFPHLVELHNRIEAELYRGQGAAAVEAADRSWTALERSLLTRSQIMRATMVEIRGRALVGAAGQAQGKERAALLGRARRDQRSLAREDAPWIGIYAHTLDAGIAAVEGRAGAAALAWRRAAAVAARAGMKLHEAAALWSALRVEGSRDESGPAILSAEGIASPERMRALFCPGLQG